MTTYKLLENDTCLLSQPALIDAFGRIGAQLLAQIHFWLQNPSNSGKIHEGEKWIYNVEKEWSKQLRCSVSTVRRKVKMLYERGLLNVAQLSDHKSNRTNYFSLNYDGIAKICSESRSFVHSVKMTSPSVQNDLIIYRTETTTKINKSKKVASAQSPVAKEQVQPVEQVEEKLSSPLREEKKPQRTLARDSLKIWNEEMNDNQKLTYSLSKFLVGALKTKLNFDLEKWRRYCKMFKDKGYLGINSALAYKTMDRILKEEVNPLAGEPITDSQISSKLEALTEPEAHKEVRRIIAKAIGYPMYYSWFHQAKLVDRNGKIQLIAPNAFVEENWKNRFSWLYLDNDLQKGT